jgi:hypothetical protein
VLCERGLLVAQRPRPRPGANALRGAERLLVADDDGDVPSAGRDLPRRGQQRLERRRPAVARAASAGPEQRGDQQRQRALRQVPLGDVADDVHRFDERPSEPLAGLVAALAGVHGHDPRRTPRAGGRRGDDLGAPLAGRRPLRPVAP